MPEFTIQKNTRNYEIKYLQWNYAEKTHFAETLVRGG